MTNADIMDMVLQAHSPYHLHPAFNDAFANGGPNPFMVDSVEANAFEHGLDAKAEYDRALAAMPKPGPRLPIPPVPAYWLNRAAGKGGAA